jgi:hypothetical protein
MTDALQVGSSAPAQTKVYLRLLYSARFGQRIRGAVQRRRPFTSGSFGFLQSVNFEQLAAEQKARIRNLSFSLRAACELLAKVLPEPQFRELVAAYAESQLFWRGLGRSLGENFCVFAYSKFRGENALFLAETARLDGVISGVAAAAAQASPWRSHLALPHTQSPSSETYSSSHCVITQHGAVRSAADPETQGSYRVTVNVEGASVRTEILPC